MEGVNQKPMILGTVAGTDKYLSGLNKVYERILTDYKDKEITFLEIGILEGGSLLMFQKMLPKAKLYGFDILPRPRLLTDPKIITREINQMDDVAIEKLAKETGGFDVIIDDGSHFTRETKNCFDRLWQHLKVGGTYIIEDFIVGVKVKGSPNIDYASRTAGMDALVYEIAKQKTELGITSIEIVVKKDWMSCAIFTK